tara:strand:+ start:1282 stop:1584 length:303 start_codon:yes stop_codon:yes gene_type:complete
MRYKYIICFLILLVTSACNEDPSQADPTGEEIYLARCAACHGDQLEGKVGPEIGKNSSAWDMPNSYWIQTMTMGKGSMPGQNLTDEEVYLIIEYIREGSY